MNVCGKLLLAILSLLLVDFSKFGMCLHNLNKRALYLS